MPQEASNAHPLRLDRMAGPEAHVAPIQPDDGQAVIGRSEGCEIALVEETVSRRHAAIRHRGSHWMLEDLGSRHGTFVNSIKIAPGQATALGEGDLIRIGPWMFRVSLGAARGSFAQTIDDSTFGTQRVERVSAEHAARMAQHRLDLLIECAGAITGAKTEEAMAETALRSALLGSGFERAALLRQSDGDAEVEIISHQSRNGGEPGEGGSFTFSRSLLREASGGQMTRLAATRTDGPVGQSIAELNITAALCAPVMIGPAVAAYLYLDSRGGSRGHVVGDAAGFCHVIARLCGLALLNIRRQEMEERQRRLEQEVAAAREAQILILPSDHGEIGCLRYAMRMRPGRFVAGDLFDVIPLRDGRVAAVIGDVTGEGVGAAMLMVAAQSHLHAALAQHGDAAAAVNIVNRYLAGRCALNRFISLWVGVFDLQTGRVDYVDAGHGHWLLKPAESRESAAVVRHTGGIPVGIDERFEYRAERLDAVPGARLVLYSDGVVEQRSPEDEPFGLDRVIELVNRSTSAVEDVRSVLAAVDAFAGRSDLSDDTTVASIEIAPAPAGTRDG